MGDLERIREQLGPDRIRYSEHCKVAVLVEWGGRWYLVEPISAAGSGEYRVGLPKAASKR